MRSELSSQPDAVKNEVDPAFVNDNYWLLFPVSCLLGHQRHGDRSRYEETADRRQLGHAGRGEISLGKAVTRPATPGNSTSAKTTASSKWSTTAVGPRSRASSSQNGLATKRQVLCWISTEHPGTADGKPLHIWLSDVAVKVTGSDKWVDAK